MTTISNKILFNRNISNRDSWIALGIFGGILVVCLLSSYILLIRDPYSLLYFTDSIPHLAISRGVYDSVDPGLSNLGGVWLPLTHLFIMIPAHNEYLFHTGLAGTLISSISTAITAVLVYKIVSLHLRKKYAGVIASVLFVTNPSVLYLAISPMMEAPFMMFFMLSAYFILKWYRLYVNFGDTFSQYRAILKATVAIAAATMTRYEGWILPISTVLILSTVFLIFRRDNQWYKLEAFGSVLALSFSGMVAWLIYNFTIFGSPLYFLTGPYSARAQTIGHNLFMNPISSLSVLIDVFVSMYGITSIFFCFLGLGSYLYMNRKPKAELVNSILLILLLLLPISTDFLAMMGGTAAIFSTPMGYFNGRFMILMAPLFSFACTSLIVSSIQTQKKVLTMLIVLIIATSCGATFYTQTTDGNVTALKDPSILPINKVDKSALAAGALLGKVYSQGKVLLFTSSADGPKIMFGSKLDLKNFIQLGNEPYWEDSKSAPWQYGTYLVMEKLDPDVMSVRSYDPINNILRYWYSHQHELLNYYSPVYEDEHFLLLSLK